MSIEEWFDALQVINLRPHYSWLAELPQSYDSIANFGCSSGCEPFALLWILHANEIAVVEIEDTFLGKLAIQKEILERTHPRSLIGRTITSLHRDMTLPIPELPDQHFDLAFCEDVLYAIDLNRGLQAVNRAIDRMIMIVKRQGLIVAVESKYRAEFETRTSDGLGIPISIPIRKTEPEDMRALFESKGLEKIEVSGQPPYSYCYRRV